MSTDITKQIEQARKQLAELESQEKKASLVDAVRKNPNISDEKLYPLAKKFCNHVEKQNRDKKAEKPE